MKQIELLEIFNNLTDKLSDLRQENKWQEGLDLINETEANISKYLDTCKFTCSDFIEREKFCKKARQISMVKFADPNATAQDLLNYAQLYNLSQNELYNLWSSWKPTIDGFKQSLKQFRKAFEVNVVSKKN